MTVGELNETQRYFIDEHIEDLVRARADAA